MLVADMLRRENNNIDLIRLIAACTVIFAHADAILGNNSTDFLYNFLLFDYSGSLAVKVFFFLSGLVVANSLLTKKNLFQYAVSRTCRVIPGLAVVLGISAFILGPMLTTLPLGEYFTNSAVYKYFFKGVLLKLEFTLPGVFTDTANNSANGSIWSIPFEMSAYFWLAVFFVVGVFRYRTLAVLVFLFLLLEPLSGHSWLFKDRLLAQGINKYMLCFAFGTLLVVFKDTFRITLPLVLALCFTYWLSRGTAVTQLVFYPALFITLLYVTSLKWVLLLKPASDISYGVYLWGWPSQQLMHLWFPAGDKTFNWVTSTVLALLCGYASWHLVEKHFMRWAGVIGKIPWAPWLCRKIEGRPGSTIVYMALDRLGCLSGR